MSEEAAVYNPVRPPRPAGETLRLLRVGSPAPGSDQSVVAAAAGATLPTGPWQVTPGEMGSGYTWKLTAVDPRDVLAIIAGPLGDPATTAAVAQAIRAVPAMIEALREVERVLGDAAADESALINPATEFRLWKRVRAALAFAGELPEAGGEAPRA